MPLEKTCPFRFIAPYSTFQLCNKSECEPWSIVMSRCSITIGMNAILSIVDAFCPLIIKQTQNDS